MPDEMLPYCITTESSCDIGQAQLAQLHVRVLPLEYRIGARGAQADGAPADTTTCEVLDAMRTGLPVSLAMPGAARFTAFWTPELRRGRDILHISLSSGIGGAYRSAVIAAAQLKRTFPDRRIHVLDSLAVSGGLALLVGEAARLRADGRTAEESCALLGRGRRAVQHLIVINDAAPLIRCALLLPEAPEAPLAGAYMVLSLDADGRLRRVGRFPDQRGAFRSLCERCFRTRTEGRGEALLLHTGDGAAAGRLAGLIRLRSGMAVEIAMPGAATAARAGPNALGLFFFGQGRV